MQVIEDDISKLRVMRYTDESISAMFDAGLAKAADLRKLLKERFTSLIDGFVENDDNVALELPATKKEHEAADIVSYMGYMNIKKFQATVPQGMDTSYKELLNTLYLCALHNNDLLIKTMRPYSEYLAVMVANKAKLQSAHIHSFNFVEINKQRDALKDKIDNCYHEGFNNTANFGDVFLSAGDFKASINELKTVYGIMLKIKQREVRKLVGVIKQHLRDIHTFLNKGLLDDLDSDSIAILSNGAYCVASEVEFMSITYYRVLTAIQGIEKTMDSLIESYNKK